MSESEGRALVRTASVLFVASLVRWGLHARDSPPLVSPDSAGALPVLLEESRRELEEVERRRTPLAEGEMLDPNRVEAWELDRLPGVGPATAAALVERREREGPYARPEDLLAVRGIGPATLEKMRAHLDFSTPAPLRSLRRDPPRSLVASSGGAVPAGPPAGGPATPDPPLDLNLATREQLEELPGVGPALAGRILEARERKGSFGSPEDLLEVRGIGPATLKRLRPLLVVR